MRRLIRTSLVVLGLLLVSLYVFGRYKDPEKTELSAAARERAPGDFVMLSNGLTFYEAAGPDTGRVVVLVHGFSVPSYIWDSTFNAMTTAGYRVLRYDVYGRGWSDRPDVAYDGALVTRQLGELLDSLRINQPVDLVGLSFGGFVTANFVASHAARVRTLTLVDPVATSRNLPGLLSIPILGSWIWQTTQVPGMADGQMSDFLHPERYPDWVEQYRPQMRYRGFGRALLRSAFTSSTTDFSALYARVAKTGVPVLLVWGKQDQTVPIEQASVIRGSIPQVEFFPVDSAGHLPHIEQSTLVHAKMREFWSKHPAVPKATL